MTQQTRTVPHWSVIVDRLYRAEVAGAVGNWLYEVDKDYWFANRVFARTFWKINEYQKEADYEIVTRHGLVLHVRYNPEDDEIVYVEVYSLHQTECSEG